MTTFTRRFIILIAASVLLLPIPNALAQKTAARFEELTNIIKPDDRITVITTNGERMTGRAVGVNATSIVITTGSSQQPRTIPSLEVARIAVPDPVGNGIKIGAGIGAGAGLAAGFFVNTYCYNEVGSCPAAVVVLTVAGAAGGAAAGWAADSLHGSRLVYDRSGPIVELQQSTDIFASVDYSRMPSLVFAYSSVRTEGQVSVSAGIGRHSASGFGAEAEVQRTVQSAVKMDPCVKNILGPQTGNCIGSGLQGLESQLVGTVRMVYALNSVRFKPFVSGGLSILHGVEQYAYVDGSLPLKVVQVHPRYNDTAVPAGGGFRVALTPSIAIRPAVTYYIGAQQTSLSVGFVYRRK